MKINIGENLRRLRTQKEMTQEQLAAVLGVSPQAISKLFRIRNNLDYSEK